MKLVFMGTPEFSVGALEAIIGAGHRVVCVVTQPDRPKGRGKSVAFPPVKECAIRHGIPVFQPVKIRTPQAVAQLKKYGAELFVVAAFGQILPREILQMPRYGCINIHASLLPKYRGAAPIQQAIIDGERESGVTIMQMDEGLDTGDMLAKTVIPISEKETGDSLHDKLMEAGAALVVETIPLIEQGLVKPERQDNSASCYAGMLKKSMGRIDWEKDAAALERLVRGLNSWPGCYTTFRGKTLKIWESQVAEPQDMPGQFLTQGAHQATDAPVPGTVVYITREAIGVQTGQGVLVLKSVQPEGKKKMQVKDFLLGYPVQAGERFGEEAAWGKQA